MCGRYTLRASPSDLARAFALFREPELVLRYNVAPTQQVPVIRATDAGRELEMMKWGLIPSWSKDAKGGARMINARAWKSPEDEPVLSCSIITTEANELMQELHDRMPVILAPHELDVWLDPECEPTALQELLDPFPAEEMSYRAVSKFVNNARNEGKECLAPPH